MSPGMQELLTVQTSAADVVLFTVTRRLLYVFLRPIRYFAGSIRVANLPIDSYSECNIFPV